MRSLVPATDFHARPDGIAAPSLAKVAEPLSKPVPHEVADGRNPFVATFDPARDGRQLCSARGSSRGCSWTYLFTGCETRPVDTVADVELLARVDGAHETLSAPATQGSEKG